MTARIDFNACLIKPQVIGVGPAPDREQHVGTDHLRRPGRALNPDADVCALGSKRMHSALRCTAMPSASRICSIAARYPRLRVQSGAAHLHHGHLSAKRRHICANSRPI